jgi:hypothetical protein
MQKWNGCCVFNRTILDPREFPGMFFMTSSHPELVPIMYSRRTGCREGRQKCVSVLCYPSSASRIHTDFLIHLALRSKGASSRFTAILRCVNASGRLPCERSALGRHAGSYHRPHGGPILDQMVQPVARFAIGELRT